MTLLVVSVSQSTCSWNTRLYTTIPPSCRPSCRNPRAHGTRVCTSSISWKQTSEVAIHVLMEHAFVPPNSNFRSTLWSQSTCSWNTRLYHEKACKCLPRVAIHVLMEHAFVLRKCFPSIPSRRNPRAHGTRVCTSLFTQGARRAVAIHVLMEHAFVPSEMSSTKTSRRNPRAHGTRVCTWACW